MGEAQPEPGGLETLRIVTHGVPAGLVELGVERGDLPGGGDARNQPRQPVTGGRHVAELEEEQGHVVLLEPGENVALDLGAVAQRHGVAM
ncbi:hypothetical protein OIB37_27900 [Streptomyces sp. NBC_00820]|nr:hypothetical protein OIB37_27900 [Streptomyces sp. NBC_00820]